MIGLRVQLEVVGPGIDSRELHYLFAGVQRSANGLLRLIYLQRAFRSQRDVETYVIEVTDFKYDL